MHKEDSLYTINKQIEKSHLRTQEIINELKTKN